MMMATTHTFVWNAAKNQRVHNAKKIKELDTIIGMMIILPHTCVMTVLKTN
jgi:hypothetical protein